MSCSHRSRCAVALCLLSAVPVAGCGGRSGGGGGAAGTSGAGCKTADSALVAAARGHVAPLRAGTGGDVSRITVDVCRTTDQDATATVVVYGMRDKRIRDVRHSVRLIKVGGLWQVTDDLDSQRCQPGHGPQTFSRELCQ